MMLPGSKANADTGRFVFTYGWFTPSKGEVEFELWHTQAVKKSPLENQFELEYGITDRWMISPYLLFGRSGGFSDVPGGEEEEEEEGETGEVFDPIRNGEAYRYKGFKLETRYRFGDYGLGKVLPAAYLEYAKNKNEKAELEGKVILQFEPNSRSTFALNIIAEQRLTSHAATEWAYSFGGAYLPDLKDRYWFGGEAFGNWTENTHYLGPTIGGRLGERARLVATYGKSLRGGNDQFRAIFSYQFN